MFTLNTPAVTQNVQFVSVWTTILIFCLGVWFLVIKFVLAPLVHYFLPLFQ